MPVLPSSFYYKTQKEMVEWERKRKITMGTFEDYDFYTLTIQKIE